MNHLDNPEGKTSSAARQTAKASFISGAVLTVLGILCVLTPLVSGVAVVVFVGVFLVAAGAVELVYAFRANVFRKRLRRFLFGGLEATAGVVLIVVPAESLGVLTAVLMALFMIGGGFEILIGLVRRPKEGWGWLVICGIVSHAMAFLIFLQWPASGRWAVGLFVGVRILLRGLTLLALWKSPRWWPKSLVDALRPS